MSYSFIKFNDEIVDSKIMMELTDLARLLLRKKDVSVAVRKYSYYNPTTNHFNLSFFWKHRQDITEREGFRHDILTRFPSPAIMDYQQYDQLQDRSTFLQQLFLSLEHYRNRRAAFKLRPLIQKRVLSGDRILKSEYQTSSRTDAEAFLKSLNVSILEGETDIDMHGEAVSIISSSTKESMDIADMILRRLKDRINTESTFQIHDMPFNEISDFHRTTPFRKDSTQLDEKEEEAEVDSSRIDTKTDRDAKEANMLGEVGDNAAQKSDHGRRNDYEDDVADYQEGFGRNAGDNLMRDSRSINSHVALEVVRPKIRLSDYKGYREIYESYNSAAQKVIGDITQILNYKMNAVQTGRTSGKLMRNPVGPLLSGSHKVFIKKNIESKEIDAAFTVIMDQSFSMTDHLEGCRNGVIIMNNILKTLHVPHRIVSHHEDSFEVMKDHYPNFIYEHIDFERSEYYYPVSLMEMEASGDNRDGLVIRHETGIMQSRNEQDRFIIVFSDGLPSAEQYNQSGIIDTHEAVQEAIKSGIQVINIFINQDNEENTVAAIQNIYGMNTLIVEDAWDIAYQLPNLIRRILTGITV